MKRFSLVTVLLIAVFNFSCDELEELVPDEIDITTSYVSNLNISSAMTNDPDESVMIQESFAFDFLNNSDVTEHVGTPEQIKRIEIVSVKYEYKNFSGNVDASSNCSLGLARGFMSLDFFEVTDTNFAEADLFGTLFTLSGDYSQVNDYVSDSKLFGGVYTGSSTHNPVDFTVEVTVTARLTLEINLDDL